MGKARRARGPSQLRIARAARPPTDRWQQVPVEPRGQARLGISFRPLQAQALGLDPMATLATLLDYPFQLIRLGAYWSRIEDGPGRFDTSELDRQIEAAEQAGKQIIVCVGPVKTFGYPEFFVPGHHLPEPLREGALVEPGRSSAATGRGGGVRRSAGAAILRSRGDRRMAGRARCRRPARPGTFLAPVRRLRAARGRGRPRGRPDPAGADERLPADVGTGAAAAVVAHPGPGRRIPLPLDERRDVPVERRGQFLQPRQARLT